MQYTINKLVNVLNEKQFEVTIMAIQNILRVSLNFGFRLFIFTVQGYKGLKTVTGKFMTIFKRTELKRVNSLNAINNLLGTKIINFVCQQKQCFKCYFDVSFRKKNLPVKRQAARNEMYTNKIEQ